MIRPHAGRDVTDSCSGSSGNGGQDPRLGEQALPPTPSYRLGMSSSRPLPCAALPDSFQVGSVPLSPPLGHQYQMAPILQTWQLRLREGSKPRSLWLGSLLPSPHSAVECLATLSSSRGSLPSQTSLLRKTHGTHNHGKDTLGADVNGPCQVSRPNQLILF